MDNDLIESSFLRALGLLVAFQFYTTSRQLKPLIGNNGIEPVKHLIAAFRRDHGLLMGFLKMPTIFWFSSADWFIRLVPLIGTLLALAFALGTTGEYQWLAVIALWFLWLSILNAAPNFFYFPWDLMLLETLLLTIFAPSLSLFPDATTAEPFSPILSLAFAMLLFRVMLGMGLSKFKDRDSRTRDGTYIYHFLSWQPMATAFAGWVRALPMTVHRLSLHALLVIECILPFFLFGPSLLRVLAIAGFIGLQVFIMACGNYGIFNVLTALLSIVCLSFEPASLSISSLSHTTEWLLIVYSLIGIPHLIFLNSWNSNIWTYLPSLTAKLGTVGSGFHALFRALKPFAIWHGYGIFLPRGNFGKVIPIIQMQDPHGEWHDVKTRYLTGPCNRRPPRFAPYHPRLDHHLFYLHLRPQDFKVSCLMGAHPYYIHPISVIDKLIEHLYRQTPDILALFASVPLKKPEAIRVATYEYELQEPSESREYWTRQLLGFTETFPRIELSSETGVQKTYDPFVFETFTLTDDGYSAITYDDTVQVLHRRPLIAQESQQTHPYFDKAETSIRKEMT